MLQYSLNVWKKVPLGMRASAAPLYMRLVDVGDLIARWNVAVVHHGMPGQMDGGAV